MFHEWKTPKPVNTPKGEGLLIASYDIDLDHHWYHMVVLDDDGSVWVFPNPKIKFTENETYGRVFNSS